MKRRTLRAPWVAASLLLPASCLLFEPLDDVSSEGDRGGAAGEAGAPAVAVPGGAGAGGAAGASHDAGGAASEAAGAGGELGGGEAGSGGSSGSAGASQGGAPSDAGAPSAGGSVSTTGGTTGGTSEGTTGGTTTGGTTGGTSGGTTGGTPGGTPECVADYTCGGGKVDDFEGCSYPRFEDQPETHKQTLGCRRPGEATEPEVHLICQAGKENVDPCNVEWAVMPHPARPGSRVLCFWGTDPNPNATPWLVYYLRGNKEDYYDVGDASTLRFSYCSNERLHVHLGCGPTNAMSCFKALEGPLATVSDNDDDPVTCDAWETLSVPLQDLTPEKRVTLRSVQLQTYPSPGPFKLCIDDVEFID